MGTMRQTASRSDIICPGFRGGGYHENSLGLKRLDPVSLNTWQYFISCVQMNFQ